MEQKEIRLVAAWGDAHPAGEVLRVLGPHDDPEPGTVDVVKARDLVELYRLAEWVTSEAPAPAVPVEEPMAEPAAEEPVAVEPAPAIESEEPAPARRRTRRAD